MNTLKHFLITRLLYTYTNLRDDIKIYAWRRRGALLPPPHILKQKLINKYRKEFAIKVFIETGTYLGQMVDAMRYRFKKLKSIELSEELYKRAKEKFKSSPHIKLYMGDSAAVLPHIIESLQEPALFWLDGHYSGGITTKGKSTTPILEELAAIATLQCKFVILIDDARLFTGEDDYPEINSLKSVITNYFPLHKVEIRDDVIRILPNTGK